VTEVAHTMNPLLTLLIGFTLTAGAAGETVTVKREGARLMKAPRSYGAACPATVAPNARVKILERQKGWGRIAAPGGGACWLHESAWSDRTGGALTGDPSRGSSRDVELAARGFNETEEARFRGEHRDLEGAFAAIEAHLARGPETPPEELERFVADGKLGGDR
jgi:hypothetical protein